MVVVVLGRVGFGIGDTKIGLEVSGGLSTEHLDLVSLELLMVEVSLGVEGVITVRLLMFEGSLGDEEIMLDVSPGEIEGGASVEELMVEVSLGDEGGASLESLLVMLLKRESRKFERGASLESLLLAMLLEREWEIRREDGGYGATLLNWRWWWRRCTFWNFGVKGFLKLSDNNRARVYSIPPKNRTGDCVVQLCVLRSHR